MSRASKVGDAIVAFLQREDRPATLTEIYSAVDAALDKEVPRSSVRSHLNAHTPGRFERVSKGKYCLPIGS